MTPLLREPARLAPSLLGLAMAVSACTTTAPATFPSATKLPDEPRKPDAVAVDRHSSPPTKRDRASSETPIVTLRAPLDDDLALRVVEAFFAGVLREDTSALRSLSSGSVRVENLMGVSSNRTKQLQYMWRDRFRRHKYERLRGRVIYRPIDVATFRGEDGQALPLRARLLRNTPKTGPTDLVLHVPIVTHTIKNERLLGSEMFFWLRRVGDDYRIVHMAEDVP